MKIITSTFVPTGFDGITVWPFIFMRYEDKVLTNHETVHYNEQAWITPIWWARYLLSKTFRVAAEVRAYKQSIAAGMTVENAAQWLMKYDSSLTLDECVKLLTS